MHNRKSPAFLREQNAITIEEFTGWMRDHNLPEEAVRRHRENIAFYVNDFLLGEDATPAEEGIHEIGTFLGYWFVRNAGSVTPEAVMRSAASLKKFYRFMYELGRVEQSDLDELKRRVKVELPCWLDALQGYLNPHPGAGPGGGEGPPRSGGDENPQGAGA
jgi:hypothetical protein